MSRKKILILSPIIFMIFAIGMGVYQEENEKIKTLNSIENTLKIEGKSLNETYSGQKNTEELAKVLSKFAVDRDKKVSSKSLFIISMLAISLHSNPQVNASLPDISQSAVLKTTLETLISDDGKDDKRRAAAIDAHSWLYPPEESIVNIFDNLIRSVDISDRATLSAIFTAFQKYLKLYKFEMPESTLVAANELINHPSDSVRADVITQLRISLGKPVLPVLIHQLDVEQSLGVVNSTIMNIILLDQSDETVRQLKEIAAKVPGSGKAKIIEIAVLPANLAPHRK